MSKEKIAEKNYSIESSKITNITHLREHALRALENLESRAIDTDEAGVTGKLCEGIIATIKVELDYARMLGKEPNIPFMGDISKNNNAYIEEKKDKYLTEKN